mgnify:CR=1 FL=1|tara:strand:- start:403 stop:1125 length:723 start_codon:yes stop_codon:yes gene_type:complete
MATYFTGWDFNRSLERALDRQDKLKANEENNKFRAKELGERIKARKSLEQYREKQLAETIKAREEKNKITVSEGEKNRSAILDRMNQKTTEGERKQKKLDRALVANIPTFDEYDQDEAVSTSKDFIFDEGEFRRAAENYISDVQKNLPNLLNALENNPNDQNALKHIEDLRSIKDVLDGGEYSGPLDSTIFDWFDGEASDAKKASARIDRILSAYDSMSLPEEEEVEGPGIFDSLLKGPR